MPGAKLRRRFVAQLLFGCAVVASVALGTARGAWAQIGSDRYASMVVDAQSGTVLEAANADEYRFPASLTKMMTIYLTFEALRDHRLSLTDAVPVSAWASSMPPTKLGLVPGSSLTVEQAVLGLVTKSANDAAAALGELLGGDEDSFAQMMTLRARGLGMTRTTFRNASGLPDWGQVTTARDLVVLARRLIQDFPQFYHYFSTPFFQFHGRTILNHQRLLQSYPGADGLKTGYIQSSGYNVVTSAMRGDVRLIGVVLGASSGAERDGHMAGLLDQGFQRMGLPIEIARREPPSYRLPMISTARAETAAAEPRWHAARGWRPLRERRAVILRRPEPRRWSPSPASARRIAISTREEWRGIGDAVPVRVPVRKLAVAASRQNAAPAQARISRTGTASRGAKRRPG